MDGQNDDDKTPTNPYEALRAAKIARNQARLKELGLHKPTFTTRKQASTTTKKKYVPPVSSGPRRRSARISGLEDNPDYKETNDFRELGRRGTKRTLNDDDDDDDDDDNHVETTEKIPPKPRISQPKPTKVAANSVKAISLDASKLVEKFLAKPMETFGKYFVIETSFHEAASEDDQERLMGVSRLSFNKFSGVQPWKNVIFLWINVGGPTNANSLVNDFSVNKNTCKVSWFGGSRMTEDSPVIQDLIRIGKESSESSAIVLWCRHYNWETRKLMPYTCLGRLAYESHQAGSYPVAFTWRLKDYHTIISDASKRSVFREITGLEE